MLKKKKKTFFIFWFISTVWFSTVIFVSFLEQDNKVYQGFGCVDSL